MLNEGAGMAQSV